MKNAVIYVECKLIMNNLQVTVQIQHVPDTGNASKESVFAMKDGRDCCASKYKLNTI